MMILRVTLGEVPDSPRDLEDISSMEGFCGSSGAMGVCAGPFSANTSTGALGSGLWRGFKPKVSNHTILPYLELRRYI